MEQKQTAVEWLSLYLKGITTLNCDDIIEQAEEMEKDQIIDSFVSCWKLDLVDGIECKVSADEYYNETYKTK